MIDTYARSIYLATIHDLNDIPYESFSGYGDKRKSEGIKYRRPQDNEIEVYSFPQTWASTALGFGGIGGQAFTTSLTVVVVALPQACVYFGGRLAYKINIVNQNFWDDLHKLDMNPVSGAKKRYESHGL